MVVKPSRRREMAQRSVKEFGASIQLACQAFRISQACYRYQAKHQAENDVIRLHSTQWMWMYNHERPNMALGGITPKQRLATAA